MDTCAYSVYNGMACLPPDSSQALLA